MSYEAWGDGEDYDVPDWYYKQVIESLHDDGWLDCDEATVLKQQLQAANAQIEALRKAHLNAVDGIIEEEAERWAERFSFLHTKYGADCSGNESGDLLDCVEDECGQVINKFLKENESLRAQLAELRGLALALPCPQATAEKALRTFLERGE